MVKIDGHDVMCLTTAVQGWCSDQAKFSTPLKCSTWKTKKKRDKKKKKKKKKKKSDSVLKVVWFLQIENK